MTLNEQLHGSATHQHGNDPACPVCEPSNKAKEVKAALAIVIAVAETVREAGRCPSGTIYAGLIGRVSMEGYNKILITLKNAGLIEETSAHELVWIGKVVSK